MKTPDSNDPIESRLKWAMGVPATEGAMETCLRAARDTGMLRVELHLPSTMFATEAGADASPMLVRIRSESLELIGLSIEWPARVCEPDSPTDAMSSFWTAMLRLLDFAAANGVRDIAVRHPPQSAEAPERAGRYENILAERLEWLASYRFEAERRGVRVAIEVGVRNFLATPSEARDFIDQCNSPWIGARLRWGDVILPVRANDWVTSLGRRLLSVEVDAPVDPKQLAALQCALGVLRDLSQSRYIIVSGQALARESLEPVWALRRIGDA